MSNLEGKVAVITGGSSGIGLATAKRFAQEDAYVFITGRRQAALDKAKAEIGKNVTTVQGDVTSLADLDSLYAQVKAEKGVIDVVFAIAGFIEHPQIFDMSEAHYDKTLDINLKDFVYYQREGYSSPRHVWRSQGRRQVAGAHLGSGA